MASRGKSKNMKIKKGRDELELPNIGSISLSTSPSADASALALRSDVEDLRQNGLTQIEQMTKALEADATRLIFSELPSIIKELDEFYRNDPRCNLTGEEVLARTDLDRHLEAWRIDPSGSEKEASYKRNRTVVTPNSAVTDLMDAVKPYLLRLANAMNNISLWIKLRVPELETGDNFGVEVQAEILTALSDSEISYLAVLTDFSVYHAERAEIVKDLMAYPGLNDIRRSLLQLDDRTYLKFQLAVADLRNETITIFDQMCKNLPKLYAPKTTVPTSTYL